MKCVLAIETSCDDTSVALIDQNEYVVGLESQNQDDVHSSWGGVIPELACRNHTLRILPLIEKLFLKSKKNWSDISGIAVTSKPGLVGSLLVGVSTAKTLAYVQNLPLIGVNHLEGHLHAPLLKADDYQPPKDFNYPFMGLCVSGGHTSLYLVGGLGNYELLGKTLDDAAGEAFDKFGKLLGLGYPAGHLVDKLSQGGDVRAFDFPKPMMKKKDLNFSFSGLKTAGRLTIEKIQTSGGDIDSQKSHLCASYQETIVDILVTKLFWAIEKTGLSRVVITGGVSANTRLRQKALERAEKSRCELLIPPVRFCTDNAAMIGIVGLRRFKKGEKSNLKLNPEAFMKVSELS